MLLRQLAIHVQKNEVGPLLHITYKKKKRISPKFYILWILSQFLKPEGMQNYLYCMLGATHYSSHSVYVNSIDLYNPLWQA